MEHLSFNNKDEVIAAAIGYVEEKARYTTSPITSPQLMIDAFRLRIADREREVFCVMYLDTQHRMIAIDELFFGTIDAASVYPREVVKAALAVNAAAVCFSHNHPSGVVDPSEADKRITERLSQALALMDIRVLDHIIVSTQGAYSFAQHGLL
jgi:DNA repair protein RadC